MAGHDMRGGFVLPWGTATEQLELAVLAEQAGWDGIFVWVVGVWPRPKSMRRVLRCDGIIPQYDLDGREHKPSDAREVRDWLTDHGAGPGLDVIAEGETPADDHAAAVAAVTPWAEAGCTWWLETRWQMWHDAGERMDRVRERLTAGPPTG
jgi:hypothetical protein